MYKCKKCELEFNTISEIANHNRWYHKEQKQYICEKCNKVFNDNSGYSIHIKACIGKKEKIKNICDKCNLEIKTCFKKHYNSCNGLGPRRRLIKGFNPKYRKGKTFVELFGEVKAKDIKEKISNSLKGKSTGKALTFEKELKRKENIKLSIKKRMENGTFKITGGRGRKGHYKDFYCDSSYELAYIIYNLEHSIKFERNNKSFEYEFENKKHKYFPDFILEDETYIEVKGFKRKNDEAKWKYFPHKLKILYANDLKEVFEYVINKYGKDYIKLYKEEQIDPVTKTVLKTALV